MAVVLFTALIFSILVLSLIHIYLEAGEWRIPAERMKMRRQHLVPLSRQAISILRELKKYSGEGKFLFPSIRTEVRPISDATMLLSLIHI